MFSWRNKDILLFFWLKKCLIWSYDQCIKATTVKNHFLTLSALQTKTDTFANSVDPDETAYNELTHGLPLS